MDPYEQGNEILKSIADEYNGEMLGDIHQIGAFFQRLMMKTNGKINVNFLDMGTWDSIESFDIDENSRLLTLVWHNFKGVERDLTATVFPVAIYTLGIYVKSVVPISLGDSAIFLLNGYSATKKDVRKLYSSRTDEFEIFEKSFYEKVIIRKIEGEFEHIQFHTTTLFSLAIVPKLLNLSDSELKRLMYEYNTFQSLQKLGDILKIFLAMEKPTDDEIVKEMAIVRRTFEHILKIEITFRESAVQKEYATIRLGDLAKQIKQSVPEKKNLLNLIIRNLNEFLHDTGKSIEFDKAKIAVALAWSYTILLLEEIRSDMSYRQILNGLPSPNLH